MFSRCVNWLYQKINSSNLNASYCLKCFFELLYYIGLCPFRLVIKRNGSSKPIVLIRQCLPQKIYCVVSTFLCLSWLVREIHSSLGFQTSTRPEKKHPKQIFGNIFQILSFLMKLKTLKNFWMDKYKFKKIASHLLSKESAPNSKIYHKTIMHKHCVIIAVFLINLLYTVVVFSEIVTSDKPFDFVTGENKPIWTLLFDKFLYKLEKLSSTATKYQVELLIDQLDTVCWWYRYLNRFRS